MQSIQDAATWNAFVSRHAPRSGAFLQSFEWGVFQEAVGRKVFRWFGRPDTQEKTELAVQAFRMDLPLGRHYLYCPRGPVTSVPNIDARLLEKILRARATETGALFFRFDPPIERSVPVLWHGLRHTIAIQPADTVLTDLSFATDTLLERLHGKTRYNLRLAERKGVTVEIGGGSLEEVWPLFGDTSHRGAFHLHPKSYYASMLEHLQGHDCRAFLAVARFEGRPLAANIMIDFAGVRTYLHGASSNEHRNLMAPFLLHWQLIEDAQKQGLRWYDWWGVAPPGVTHHPWAGVTRFKQGWGGEHVAYPGTFDLVTKPGAYALYQLARTTMRRVRG